MAVPIFYFRKLFFIIFYFFNVKRFFTVCRTATQFYNTVVSMIKIEWQELLFQIRNLFHPRTMPPIFIKLDIEVANKPKGLRITLNVYV